MQVTEMRLTNRALLALVVLLGCAGSQWANQHARPQSPLHGNCGVDVLSATHVERIDWDCSIDTLGAAVKLIRPYVIRSSLGTGDAVEVVHYAGNR